jgi:hypothetical protein
MKHFHHSHIISIVGEKNVRAGSKGSRQWQLLKQFNEKSVEDFEKAAKKATNLNPSETFQQGKWWVRELDYCWDHKVISINSVNAPTGSKIIEPLENKENEGAKNDKTLPTNATNNMDVLKLNENQKINMNGVGVYMAYPTTSVLKPIYQGYKAQVNDMHTKVGITEDSFSSRKNSYLKTFGGEVKFIPVAEIKMAELKNVEKIIVADLSTKFQKVGRTREWFETNDRNMILEMVLESIKTGRA